MLKLISIARSCFVLEYHKVIDTTAVFRGNLMYQRYLVIEANKQLAQNFWDLLSINRQEQLSHAKAVGRHNLLWNMKLSNWVLSLKLNYHNERHSLKSNFKVLFYSACLELNWDRCSFHLQIKQKLGSAKLAPFAFPKRSKLIRITYDLKWR